MRRVTAAENDKPSLLQTTAKGVVDQINTTTAYAINIGMFPPPLGEQIKQTKKGRRFYAAAFLNLEMNVDLNRCSVLQARSKVSNDPAGHLDGFQPKD